MFLTLVNVILFSVLSFSHLVTIIEKEIQIDTHTNKQTNKQGSQQALCRAVACFVIYFWRFSQKYFELNRNVDDFEDCDDKEYL